MAEEAKSYKISFNEKAYPGLPAAVELRVTPAVTKVPDLEEDPFTGIPTIERDDLILELDFGTNIQVFRFANKVDGEGAQLDPNDELPASQLATILDLLGGSLAQTKDVLDGLQPSIAEIITDNTNEVSEEEIGGIVNTDPPIITDTGKDTIKLQTDTIADYYTEDVVFNAGVLDPDGEVGPQLRSAMALAINSLASTGSVAGTTIRILSGAGLSDAGAIVLLRDTIDNDQRTVWNARQSDMETGETRIYNQVQDNVAFSLGSTDDVYDYSSLIPALTSYVESLFPAGDPLSEAIVQFLENSIIAKEKPQAAIEKIYVDSVVERRSIPPTLTVSQVGNRYIINDPPSGSWLGQPVNTIATYDTHPSIWTFEYPQVGYTAYVQGDNRTFIFNGNTWEEVS